MRGTLDRSRLRISLPVLNFNLIYILIWAPKREVPMEGSESDSFDWDAVLDSYSITDDAVGSFPNGEELTSQDCALSPTLNEAGAIPEKEADDQGQSVMVPDWTLKALHALNEQFSIIMAINMLKRKCETDLEDLNHQVQLYQLKLDSIKQSHENFFLKERNIRIVSPIRVEDHQIPDMSIETRNSEANAAKSRGCPVSLRSRHSVSPGRQSSSSSSDQATVLAPFQGPKNDNNSEMPSEIDLFTANAADSAAAVTGAGAEQQQRSGTAMSAARRDGSGARMGGSISGIASGRIVAIGSSMVGAGQRSSQAGATSTQIASSSSRRSPLACQTNGERTDSATQK